VLGIAMGLVLYALSDTIVFFDTPNEITEKGVCAMYACWSSARLVLKGSAPAMRRK
jgi:cytochrome c-type biogenesis protein CcmE